jgi:hypothetical protein
MSELTLRRGFAGPDDEERYLAGLNTCFPGWGGRDRFDWCFRRRGAGRLPDVVSLWDGARVIAGNGLSYRRVEGRGRAAVAGIITASWTLPDERRRGCMTRLIEGSRAQVLAAGGELVLGFVTADNASGRRMQAAGSRLVPTWYCRSTGPAAVIAPDESDVPGAGIRFVYDGDERDGQFGGRPGLVSTVAGREWTAIVEHGDGVDRLLGLDVPPGEWTGAVSALAAGAHERGRYLFVFTSRRPEAQALGAAGFTLTDGWLTVLNARAPGAAWSDDPWVVQNGDRM